jgi:hypothetical protein
VPWTAGAGEFQITVAPELGAVCPVPSDPVTFDWKWQYGIPGVSFWLIAVVLLVAMKMNRDLNTRVMLGLMLLGAIIWQAL